jgi:tubulin polyglutamylase TTLL9
MTANTQFDFDLKCGLFDDVLTIVDVERVVNNIEEQVGDFDLIYKNGPVLTPALSAAIIIVSHNSNVCPKRRQPN